MVERARVSLAAWGVVCLALFALLGLAAHAGWSPLREVDDTRALALWAGDQGWLDAPLRVVEVLFGGWETKAYGLILVLAMVLRGHRRAAVYAFAVVAVTGVATPLLKAWIGRPRPSWQSPEHLLADGSYPSGHASATAALAVVSLVLVWMLVRKQAVRRLLAGAVAVVVLLVALDRVLLGRHYPSDVVGGMLLALGVALLARAVYTPLPRSHAARAEPLPEAIPSRRRLAVVLNPSKIEDETHFRSIVGEMAVDAGWSEPSWHLTTVDDSGTGQAERAAVGGADLVIVCGGDGTVREVCAELAGTGIPVGIIPAGTGNLLARNLDLPLYIRAAIDVALNGQDRAIDMVKVSGDVAGSDEHGEDHPAGDDPGDGPGDGPGEASADGADDVDAAEVADRHGTFDSHFLVMAGMGFDAAIMEGVNEDMKARVGWLAYVMSGFRSIMFPATRVEISVDGGEYTKHRARTIVVGNVGYLQAGLPLLPNAAIDDGVLDVVLLHPRRFLSWVPLAFRVLTRRTRTDETINRMTGRTVSIRAGSPIPRQLDGDSIGPGRELHMECVHGRLLVRVPR